MSEANPSNQRNGIQQIDEDRREAEEGAIACESMLRIGMPDLPKLIADAYVIGHYDGMRKERAKHEALARSAGETSSPREACTRSHPHEQMSPECQRFADYEEVLADHRRLVRELDVLLNGDNAAKQASLCDIVGQLAGKRRTAETTREPPYRVRAFWSPEKRHLVTVCCSMDDITLVDDNANIWEATGPEEDVADPKNFQKEPDASPVKTEPDCSMCNDTGEVDETLGGYSFSDPHAPCPDCRHVKAGGAP